MRLIDADKFCDIIDDKCLSLAKKLGYRTYEDASENMKWYLNGVSDAVGTVLDMPTVEPKTGKWIADGQKQKHGYEWMHCSVCGFSDIDDPTTHTNFCPNCGADMRGEEK